MGRGWLRFTDHIDNLVHGSSRAAGDDDGGENYFAAAFVAALGKEFGGPEGRADEVSCTRMLRALSAHRTTVTAATATFTCPLGCALLCWSVCRAVCMLDKLTSLERPVRVAPTAVGLVHSFAAFGAGLGALCCMAGTRNARNEWKVLVL
eukprot:scaffold165904_cov18-Tisochrysis_lutea.AAC.1